MDFNSEQQAAILCRSKHILVLAGAGTGKTRTIIGRAEHLLRSSSDTSRIAVITFTRRAANEIRQRLTGITAEQIKRVVTGTFHNFCLREMSARRQWFGLDELTIMDRDDQTQLMKLARGEVVGKRGESSVPQSTQLLNYYSYARNTNQPVGEYLEKFTEESPAAIEQTLKVLDAYKARKRARGYVDFDDILHRFAKVLRDDQKICRHIAGQYQHLLVDEMQDTNPLQWLILESLAPYQNLFCVGDDAQSIYAFRGADFRNVHSFKQRLTDAQILKLELNYRSTQEILDLSNWLLAQSKLQYNKQLSAIRGSGIKPQLLEFESDLDEATWVGEQLVQRQRQGIRWDDQLVLCRTSNHARPIEAELIRRKIPYRFIGGISLLQTAHVKDLLSAMRIAVNHRDELAWVRCLTMWPGVGEATAARWINQVAQLQDGLAAVKALAERPLAKQLVQPLGSTLESLDEPAKCIANLGKNLETILNSRYDNWESRKADFRLLEKLAEKFSSTAAFLETYTLDPISSTEANDGPEDILTLITVHSAKGTEAKVCFVVAAQPGSYPHSRSKTDDEVEEERRVLYVALTRAKDELILSRSYSSRTSGWITRSLDTSAYFLQSLPTKLVRQSMPSVSRPRMRRRSQAYWDDDVIS